MSDPVHPDQPYTPSEDEVLLEKIIDALYGAGLVNCFDYDGETVNLVSAIPSDIADALLPLIASVRRDAQADALDALAEELQSGPRIYQKNGIAWAATNSLMGAGQIARHRAAAIRRNENGYQS